MQTKKRIFYNMIAENADLKVEEVRSGANKQYQSLQEWMTVLGGFKNFDHLRQFLRQRTAFVPCMLVRKSGAVHWKKLMLMTPGSLWQFAKVTDWTLNKRELNGDEFRIAVYSTNYSDTL